MHLTDSHVHLTDPLLFTSIDDVIERARLAGVARMINVCLSLESLERGKRLHLKYPWIQNAGAIHPNEVMEASEKQFDVFAKAARDKQLVAIGETGLDYYYGKETKEKQIEWLTRHFHLAMETSLPIIFHCRDAFADLIAVADAEYPQGAPAVLHCFTGTALDAKRALDRGWFLSFSGILTFKKNLELQEIARQSPLDQILIETDAPYLAPQSRRGKVNEPAFIKETAAYLAMLRNISLEEVAVATSKNAERLFGLC